MIRPSLTLILDLDESFATDETIQELKRSYSHIGTPVIRTHKTESDEQPHNTARALLKLGTKKYLNHADEGADELWADVMEQWIGNAFHRIGNNMKVFNDRQREIKLPQIFFNSFEIVLQGGTLTIAVHPSPEGLMDPSLKTAITAARDLYNESLTDSENGVITTITIPADASYCEQNAAAWEAWVEVHPEALPADEAADVDESEADIDTEAALASETSPTPATPKTREELLAEDIIAKSYENTAVSATDSDALPSPERFADAEEDNEDEEQFTFDVDYSLWGVAYENGSERLFDSETGTFVVSPEAA